MNHEFYMRRALALAAKGAGWVCPNPQVGALVVRDGEIIGEGYHTRCGNLHAEREALADCVRKGNSPAGATIYVTLEPCCHTGKQPPCTEALVEAGIARVVMGAPDPNPLVAGKGIAQLRAAGIKVIEGVLVEECQRVNRAWLHFIQTKRPFVTLKYAMTLDGKTATHTGSSQWITGEVARQRVHEDRAKTAAILVGVGTVIADNPQLTARPKGNHNPHQPSRIVIDPTLRTPLGALLVQRASEVPTVIACAPGANPEKRAALETQGCEVWEIPATRCSKDTEGRCTLSTQLDLGALLDRMGDEGIDSLVVEGGAKTAGAFLDAGLIDCVQAYIAPKLVGGNSALSPIGGGGIELMGDAMTFAETSMEILGDDVLVTAYRRPAGAREGDTS